MKQTARKLNFAVQRLSMMSIIPSFQPQPIQQQKPDDESFVLKNLIPPRTLHRFITDIVLPLTMNEVIQYSENIEYELLWIKDALERIPLNERPIRFLNGKWWVYDVEKTTTVYEWKIISPHKLVMKTFERFYNMVLKTYTNKYEDFKGDKGEFHLEIFNSLLSYEESKMIEKRMKQLDRIKPIVRKQ